MSTYARIESGVVAEMIGPRLDDDGNEIAIGDRFTAEFVATLIDVTEATPEPTQGWTFDGYVFAAPVPPVRSAADILSTNARYRDQLLISAGLAIDPLQDAVDLDEASAADTALLKQWKQYRIAVNRIDLTIDAPAWPAPPVAPAYAQVNQSA